jgi:HK97 family phage major capsid protein
MALDIEVKAEFDSIKTALETKTATEVKAQIDALEVKMATASKADKDAIALQIKEVTDALDAKYLAEIKKIQDHADKLDVKLQEKGGKQEEFADFNTELAKALTLKADDIKKLENKEIKNFSLDLKAVGDFTTANVTGGSRYGQIFAPEIIMNPSRKIHMDEILPGGTIGAGNSYTFMKENGAGEGAIAPVAEGGAKPQFDLDLVEATVQIETIAGWIRITRKAMNNIPGLISFLQRRLPQKFRNVLDAQILYGTGTSPQLKGILTAGNFTASTATITLPLIEKIITDVSVLEDTYERDANAILLRPVAYYSFFLNKAAGSGEYDLPQGVSIISGRLYFMGIPAYATTALTGTDYVVADLEGAQLLTQESMRIEFFEQDQDNVIKNMVTVRIEGNFALPVYGATYFIKGTTAQA